MDLRLTTSCGSTRPAPIVEAPRPRTAAEGRGMAARRTASGTGTRLSWAAALSVVVGLSACSSAPTEPTPTQATTTAAAPAACSASDSALADLGARIWTGIKDTFAASDANQFQDVRAVLVSVCGRPVVAQYLGGSTASTYHAVSSVTKSVTSTLVGIALADGSLKSLDQTLADLLPQRRDAMSPAVAALTLRQLLTMSAGLDADGPNSAVGGWAASKDFVDGILRTGVTGTPGTFAYSTGTSHVLAAILVQATGRPVLEYAREKLFDPLAIATRPADQPVLEEQSLGGYDTSGFSWPVDHQGVNFGGGWLRLTPADLLKLGQLFLDEGRYDGKQVVPAAVGAGCHDTTGRDRWRPRWRGVRVPVVGHDGPGRARLCVRRLGRSARRGGAVEAARGGVRHRGAVHHAVPEGRRKGLRGHRVVRRPASPRILSRPLLFRPRAGRR